MYVSCYNSFRQYLRSHAPCTAEPEKIIGEKELVEASQSLAGLIKPDQPDTQRAVALLRPLAKHKILRDSILTVEVIDGFLQLLDSVICVPGKRFVHVMNALSSLVELCMLANHCMLV